MHRDNGELVTRATLQLGHRRQLIGAGTTPVGPQVKNHLPPGEDGTDRNPGPTAFQRYPGQFAHPRRTAGVGAWRQLRLAEQFREGFRGVGVPAFTRGDRVLPLRHPPPLIVLLRQHDGDQRGDQHHPHDRPPCPGAEPRHVTTRPGPAGARFPAPSRAARPARDLSGPVRTTGSPWPVHRHRMRACGHDIPADRGRSPGG